MQQPLSMALLKENAFAFMDIFIRVGILNGWSNVLNARCDGVSGIEVEGAFRKIFYLNETIESLKAANN